MSRVVAIDYGSKRVGLAVSDPLKIIASPLTTVHSKDVIDFLKNYHQEESIECFVLGMPQKLDTSDTDATVLVKGFHTLLKKVFPDISIHLADERFTSKIATQAMVMGGVKKKERQKKENVDKIAATLILQTFLENYQT